MGNCSECINTKNQAQINFAEEGDLINRKSKSTVGYINFPQDEYKESDIYAGRNLYKIILIQRNIVKYLSRIKSGKNKAVYSFYKSFDLFNYHSNKAKNNNLNDKETYSDRLLNNDNYEVNGNNMIVKLEDNKEINVKKSENIFTMIYRDVENHDEVNLKKLKNKKPKIFDTENKDYKSSKTQTECNHKSFDLKYIKLENGNIYLGNTLDNKADGFGNLILSEGDVYSGQWKDDEATGVGIYTNLIGCSYNGFWEKNKRNGYGVEKWTTGSHYEGYFLNGCKHHLGVLYLEDESFYEGEFNNNAISGVGTFYFKDQRIFYGEWKNNKMNGHGILTWSDGKRFEGSFVDDKKEGFGIFYAKNKIYIANWKNSKLDGDVIIIQNGSITKSYWNMGKKIKTFMDNLNHPYDKIAEEIVNSREFLHDMRNI
jgi:hypothetical protein